MIPSSITIKHQKLPDAPGVYFYFDKAGKLLYIGKATSLKRRVTSYFTKAQDRRIAEMVSQIAQIDYQETPTVIEALVLEANQIKAQKPKYNILQQDDKSFLYLVITNEDYPRPQLVRGHELTVLGINPFQKTLSQNAKKRYLAVYGPYTSGRALKTALDLIRHTIPWSDCIPNENGRPCFYAQIGLCPGVCTQVIEKKSYRKMIRQLMLFFEGKKKKLLKEWKKDMERFASERKFEQAARLRNQIFSLEHIQDIALIQKEDRKLIQESTTGMDLEGRIEAYDISNISGTSAVGSMVVFEKGKPCKDQYRKFRIKTVQGSNDVGMLEEVIRRRLRRASIYPLAWPLPELMIIDGGEGQVSRVKEVLKEAHLSVPVIGIAKGPDRKQDRLVFDRTDQALLQVAERGKELFQHARDEAHRFAVNYHRQLRTKKSFHS
ncbi:MAG: Excinuclease ABC subunit C [Candidatus Uhrbacteria bacterium GW2011_GWE2_40_58]|nr:MAG: Excinuclease ABC subunit C [Candidatus Uhrbacteria bacterium GW2011_GWF2_40_263]KKR67555.1 MAG: Excinuclease ABC subunit C [Candidatus Uhrbacteria bacterium GW2011_GWE2_40_58]OGL96484.1 MAG: hypothetical protein A2332_04875 [Candidatus Uhrbacteria bacterium RIFOXYB2_FULL_41_18]HBK34583.1 hypothetical protein [Candidatus Uhrbacteria bacterium]HCB55378.1 hypothetical protein [Candidatus Uhrbacteria bacterium]